MSYVKRANRPNGELVIVSARIFMRNSVRIHLKEHREERHPWQT